ncbi:type II toxin-antitoxin system VapB family antitoxin [Candidatus Acetothermia bacterium]|nr:type II toxin-antitoxin system VapB family antitoxin [Candidatus Acetothermia bacterium]
MHMRTTIDLEEKLIQKVMKLLGVKTKREAVQRALESVIAQKRRESLQAKLGRLDLKLTLKDLEQMRRDD